MSSRPWALLGVATLLLAGLAITALGGTIAAQQPEIISVLVTELPIDPVAPTWDRATALDVVLAAQTVVIPRLLKVGVPTVSVRSLHDGKRISFLLEWADETRDAHATRPDDFRDAAAILFPVGDFVPNVCMGSPGQETNLWHWKADWQEDIDKGFQEVVDAYPNFFKDSYPFATGQPPFRAPADFASAEARTYFVALAAGNPFANMERLTPVEELVSAGFGTATHKIEQSVGGRGVWNDGRWRVVFTRQLAATDQTSVNMASRHEFPVALAVWNGSNEEAGARKQFSALVEVEIQGVPEEFPLGYVIAGIAVLLGAAAVFVWLRKRQRSAA